MFEECDLVCPNEKVTHVCGCTVTYCSDDPEAKAPAPNEVCWQCRPCEVCGEKSTPLCPSCDPFGERE